MKRVSPPALVRIALLALLLVAAPALAQQGEPDAGEPAAAAQSRVEKVLDSVDSLSAWREQLLQRFSSADPGQLQRLRERLDALVSRRNSLTLSSARKPSNTMKIVLSPLCHHSSAKM